MKLIFLPHNKITPNKNPRKNFEGIEELRENIKAIGITTPLIVDLNHHLIDGERRWRASEGVLKELPCVEVDRKDWDKEDERLKIQISIDSMHKYWNAIERAEAWKRYLDLGHTQRELGRLLGHKEKNTSTRLIKLLGATAPTLEKLRKDDTNYRWHQDVEVIGTKLPDKQRAVIHQRIFDGAYESIIDLNESLKLAVDNPHLVEKIAKATTPHERQMIEFGETPSQERVQRRFEKRGFTEADKEKKIVGALISSLNQINMARMIWERTDAIDLLKKHLEKKDMKKVIESIETITKVWKKTLTELK